MRLPYAAIAIFIVAATSACSQIESAQTETIVAGQQPGTSIAATTTTPNGKARPTTTVVVTTTVPVTVAPTPSTTAAPTADPAAAQTVVAAVGPTLALNEPELACLTERLAADPALTATASKGVEPNTETFFAIATIGQACADAIRFGPLFAQQAQDEAGGTLSDEQVACLRDRYGELSVEDVQTLTSAALDPEGHKADPANGADGARPDAAKQEKNSEGRTRITGGLRAACGV